VKQAVHRADNRQTPGSIRALAQSFQLSLEAGNKSPRTIKTYLKSVEGVKPGFGEAISRRDMLRNR